MAGLMMRKEPATDLGRALQALIDAVPGYVKAHNYYGGALPEVFGDARLKAAIRRAGFSLNFNFSHNVVDAVTDRLEIAAVTADDSVPNTEITNLWEANRLGLQAPRVMSKAGIFGDAYLLVWPDDDAEPGEDETPQENEAQSAGHRAVKMRYQDPRGVRIMYRNDDPLEPDYAIKRWALDKVHPLMRNTQQLYFVDLYYADRIEHYQSRIGSKGDDEDDYAPAPTVDTDGDNDAAPHPAVEQNPYGVMPMFHFRTGADTYGHPEHQQAYSPQDGIHEAVLDLITTLAYAGHPQRYRLLKDGADTSQGATGDEGRYTYAVTASGATRNTLGEPQSQLKSSPGSLWDLTQTASVGQFDAADSSTFLNTINSILRYIGLITNTPFQRLDPSGQIQSGEALRTLEAPFVKKVRNRQLTYGATWSAAFAFALKLMGHDNAAVTVRWAPAASTDDSDTWALVAAKQKAGVPAAVTLVESGYDADTVDGWMKDSGYVLQQKMTVMIQLGEFLAAAGTAVAAGAVSPEAVQQVIENVVGDLTVQPTAE